MAMLHNVRHNQAMHDPVVLLTVQIENRPWVPLEERLAVERIDDGWYRIVAHFGFKQRLNIVGLIELFRQEGIPLDDSSDITYYLSRMTLDIGNQTTMPKWRKLLFVVAEVARLCTACPPARRASEVHQWSLAHASGWSEKRLVLRTTESLGDFRYA